MVYICGTKLKTATKVLLRTVVLKLGTAVLQGPVKQFQEDHKEVVEFDAAHVKWHYKLR